MNDFDEATGDRFRALQTGVEKLKMIDNLREMGEPRTADQLIEDWYVERNKWLSDHNLENKDVLTDDEGREYFLDIIEMDEGENGDYSKKAVYLPEELDVNYWLK
jgi:hypothetical protein